MKDKKKLVGIVFGGGLIMLGANLICFILGYLRDALIVRNFGASSMTDAWYIAYNVPELLMKFLLFGALGATFVPVFIEHLSLKKEEEAWGIASAVINCSALLLMAAMIAGMIFASSLVHLFAPGFDPATHLLSTQLTRAALPLLVIIGVSGLLGSIYTSYFNYLIPALTSVVSVSCLVLFIFIFSERLGIFSVAWGMVLGNALSLLILISFFFIKKKPYRFKISFKHPAIREILWLMLPLIGVEIIGKGIGIVDRIFASFLKPGSITSFNLANRIMDIPVVFFSTTVATTIFPLLSKYIAENDREGFYRVLVFATKMCLVIIFPCIIGLIVIGEPVLRALFEYGKFQAADIKTVWELVLCLSWGLVVYSIWPLLARACYAMKKNWLLLYYELSGFVLNLVLVSILVRHLGLKGIALATTSTAFILTTVLLWVLRKEAGDVKIKSLTVFLFKIFLASLFTGAYCFFAFYILGGRFDGGHKIFLMKVTGTVLSSGALYLILLRVFKTKEMALAWKTFGKILISKSNGAESA